jgi:hypothetical protein
VWVANTRCVALSSFVYWMCRWCRGAVCVVVLCASWCCVRHGAVCVMVLCASWCSVRHNVLFAVVVRGVWWCFVRCGLLLCIVVIVCIVRHSALLCVLRSGSLCEVCCTSGATSGVLHAVVHRVCVQLCVAKCMLVCASCVQLLSVWLRTLRRLSLARCVCLVNCKYAAELWVLCCGV